MLIFLDLTSSMTPWINTAKDFCTNIVQRFKKEFNNYKLRVGFVGYRDFVDKEPFIIQMFTEDVSQIEKVISK